MQERLIENHPCLIVAHLLWVELDLVTSVLLRDLGRRKEEEEGEDVQGKN